MENLLFLGVPILKHIRVYLLDALLHGEAELFGQLCYFFKNPKF